jgi:hypothetical protein
MEFVREVALAILAQPIVIAKTGAKLQDCLAQLLLIGCQ